MVSQSNWYNSYKIIDTSNWKRKLHCEIFRNALQPYYSVCLELDISNFLKKVKENKWSFSLAFRSPNVQMRLKNFVIDPIRWCAVCEGVDEAPTGSR